MKLSRPIILLFAAIASLFALSACNNNAEPTTIETEVTRLVTVEVEVQATVEVPVTVEVEVPVTVEVEVMVEPSAAPPATATPIVLDQSNTGNVAVDAIDYDLLVEVIGLIEAQFDGQDFSDEELTEVIIEGLISSLDDEFTSYIGPAAAERLREEIQGSYEGIGAFVRLTDDGEFQIVRPIEGSPAAAAGLLPDDIVTAVDGVEITGWTIDETISIVRGPRGSDVELTIRRDGGAATFDVTITRDRIEQVIVESELIEGNIGYVRLSTFLNPMATSDVEAAIDELLDQGIEALVFDMRDNGGGFLDQAIRIADLFLEDGVVLTERDSAGREQVYRAFDGNLAEDIPLVVLVNGGSASASEIVAGAIQDNGRAVLIGDTTFGKGSVQRPNTLSNGGEIRITIARWYLPSERTLDGIGIEPDIIVETDVIDLGGPEDVQLQRAVEYIRTGE